MRDNNVVAGNKIIGVVAAAGTGGCGGRLPRLAVSGRSRAQSMLQGANWRLSVLHEGLVRIEWSPDGNFEDRPSALALNRDFATPNFEARDLDDCVEVETRRFLLRYDRRPFSSSGLSIEVVGVPLVNRVWRYGSDCRDLGGTVRTLDGVDGRVKVGPGVVSRRGIAVLDDSKSFLFEADGWVAPRSEGYVDLYAFCFGRDYAEALRVFYALSGLPPLLPRFALGNWWSRWYPYTAEEYVSLFERFQQEGTPFSVGVLDMDWHHVGTVSDVEGGGWTGFSWNRDLIPEPEAFLSRLHELGLKVALNLHPGDGVRSFEDRYREVCKAVGQDAAEGRRVAFDPADRIFMQAYFAELLHPVEDQGVDFWWVDWQSGTESGMPGLDPLWALNHFHFLDAVSRGRAPLILSRFPGPGGHRYPVGFSGDTVSSWDSLTFQPEFTATASNIGFGWWSHDIGGHYGGGRDDGDEELFVRWLQWGVFSPICRLHSNRNEFIHKEPFSFGPTTKSLVAGALRFRHRLVPYLDTMNYGASEGLPLVMPVYYFYPKEEAAYKYPNEYVFGSELLVLPITAPASRISGLGSTTGWVPPGRWVDIFTGYVYSGPKEVKFHRTLASIPVLLREGGIVALSGEEELNPNELPRNLELLVAPGANGTFTLLERDPNAFECGSSWIGSGKPERWRTKIDWEQERGVLTIRPAEGDGDVGPAEIVPRARSWVVTLVGCAKARVNLSSNGALEVSSPTQPGSVSVATKEMSTSEVIKIVFGAGCKSRTAGVLESAFAVLDRARYSFAKKSFIWEVLRSESSSAVEKVAQLQAAGVAPELVEALTELLALS